MTSAGSFRSSAATDPGPRSCNEDAYVDRPDLGLWAVADGVGGHQHGNIASGCVVAALDAIPVELNAAEALAAVRQKLDAVHSDLRRKAAGAVVASTVVVLLARDGHFACLWAGDSRAYLLRDGQLTQLTRDHSMVQELVDAGLLSPAGAEAHPNANVITRAIGDEAKVLTLDKHSAPLLPGDRFVLCSDGLTKSVPDAEITVLAGSGGDARRLVREALARQARDNVTVLVVDIEPAL